MMAFIKNKLSIYVFLLILIGVAFRFYNLNWGSPFYFHPDERNIASSVLNVNFPNQMNPHFFAYGSFPIYLIYFTGLVLDLFLKPQDLFIQAIIISRFYSAVLSLLLIPSIYFIGAKLINKKIGVLSAFLSTFSVGLIQFSRFGTFEMWLTFFGIWFFYFSVRLTKDLNLKNTIITGIIFGLLMATKISSLPLLILPLISIAISLLPKFKTHVFLSLTKALLKLFILIFVSLATFTIFSPYVFLDFKSFLSSMQYESSVALGTLPVFYTGEFFNSIPVLFQFTKIYPFLLNPLLTILSIPSLIYVFILYFKKRNPSYLLLITCCLLLFIPQAFLFAKWTRYILPTLPFIYLMLAIFFEKFINKKILQIIILVCIFFAGSYFITAFTKGDTRIEASLWAKKNIPSDAKVISEVYDMGIVPFNQYLKNITLFNFYDLDQIPDPKKAELNNLLSESEYIILPSPRILKTRLLNQNKFSHGYKFYSDLMNGDLGYKKIYETQCDIFCKITYLSDQVFSFEQTANAFDRPIVFIFKKI